MHTTTTPDYQRILTFLEDAAEALEDTPLEEEFGPPIAELIDRLNGELGNDSADILDAATGEGRR